MEYYTQAASDLTSISINDELEAMALHSPEDLEGLKLAFVTFLDEEGSANVEKAQVAFFPSTNRAGISWGADADWTDASSIEDAVERYLGINEKYMSN